MKDIGGFSSLSTRCSFIQIAYLNIFPFSFENPLTSRSTKNVVSPISMSVSLIKTLLWLSMTFGGSASVRPLKTILFFGAYFFNLYFLIISDRPSSSFKQRLLKKRWCILIRAMVSNYTITNYFSFVIFIFLLENFFVLVFYARQNVSFCPFFSLHSC